MTMKDVYTLNNGVEIPVLGFGTYLTPNDDTGKKAILTALQAGYRHIDTAAGYNNEKIVGQAVKESGLDRGDLFITSKLQNSDRGYEATVEAIETSLRNLNMDYIDMYLIHWPKPLQFRDRWKEMNADSWKAFEAYYKAGKIKAVGVSNFQPDHLKALLDTAQIIPAVNQIRLCPGDVAEDTLSFCKENNIFVEAYSPLGRGLVFDVPEIQALASKHGKSVAQVCLKWSLQKGFLPIPKSVTPERIIDNMAIFDFILEEKEVAMLTELTGRCGISENPETVQF